MHQLFSQVLGQRDLSRAGDLFSLEDTEIEACLSQALDQIKAISCSQDYLTNDNDQAVVEICITRITTAIRETGSIEQHSTALVGLWESCLEHNLTPQGENTEDTPHAKIASDITSCILQNYSCPSVMVLAVPVAVRFLQRGNRELSRNMSSYLSLAAIAKADLLAEHTEAITLSVLGGNHMLLRVLPSVYPRQLDTIHSHLGNLTAMMSQLESPEQQHLIRLIQIVAEQHPLTHAHSSLVYLVSCLGNMEHSFHHTLLLEIRALADRYPSLLGGCGKDIYRMSNSFTAIARLLGRRLEENTAIQCRVNQSCLQSPCAYLPGGGGGGSGSEDPLQVKIQAFDEKMVEEGEEEEVEEDSPAPQRRYSLSQAIREERREMRFNRSKSLALHAVRSRSINSDTGEDGEGLEPSPDHISSNTLVNSHSENQEALTAEMKVTGDGAMPITAALDKGVKEAEIDPSREKEEQEDADRLFIHLRDNMETITEFCRDMVQQIPVPEQCAIEDSNRGCVAKLSFSCPLKGHYCLYAKSCFNLTSRQPHLWIHIMLLHLQSKSSVALCSRDECVQKLASIWEKTQLKGAHSFLMAMTQHTTPNGKDLDSLQIQLEEVRFFDLFGYSEEEGGWLCFMCNNPEKATVVNQEGQPLIEGKLKEKQVRWKFIKRWKTRYFTLAGNQLLFRRGKSKDELDDIPIELSKVQSVKVVTKKRRDRGLPRAFEIFTDSKTYVLKAQDEKHAEEWLQCINVAVAQARERENREATTYL
ncbi:ventricular zone-expressed PH domain-containing protein isoform X2 [Etheostoma spectabile]|uniref:ventricular zone-expressed PH domain-containing protein isoform X2 n=1 Tax=Etheostoma spectabile TaxID=54343 RepID=UPI0013AEF450|nr:ventricular zone-expressed PH domain-containing protein homolog 1 isoform X2 [Etheostoma spectabile]